MSEDRPDMLGVNFFTFFKIFFAFVAARSSLLVSLRMEREDIALRWPRVIAMLDRSPHYSW
jgi:hypothetical protein